MRGALAVYVKALHCLMLNTSFCTSRFRGLCMSVMGREGVRVGNKLHGQMVTAHTTHWLHRCIYVQVNL